MLRRPMNWWITWQRYVSPQVMLRICSINYHALIGIQFDVYYNVLMFLLHLQLDYYVRTPKVYESYLYYEKTLKSLDDLVALLA